MMLIIPQIEIEKLMCKNENEKHERKIETKIHKIRNKQFKSIRQPMRKIDED